MNDLDMEMKMSKKMGRPKVDNPKNVGLRVRVTEEMNKQIIEYSEENNVTRGEVVRMAVTEFFKK